MCDCSCCTGCANCQCHVKAMFAELIKPLEKHCEMTGYGRGIMDAMNAIRNCTSMADVKAKMDILLIDWQQDYQRLMKEYEATRR